MGNASGFTPHVLALTFNAIGLKLIPVLVGQSCRQKHAVIPYSPTAHRPHRYPFRVNDAGAHSLYFSPGIS